MKRPDPKYSIRLRTTLVGIALFLFLSIIGAKAAYLQVYRGKWLSEKAAGEYAKSLKSSGKRGTIFDAKLRELAVSIDVTSIGVFPSAVRNRDQTATALANALAVDVKELKNKLTTKNAFVWIKRHVPPKDALAVKELNLQGVEYIEERSRVYPYKVLASQVLGFSGIDGNGLEGLEYYFDHLLRGSESNLTVLKDALGRGFEEGDKRFTRMGGNNLILTIDRRIQYITDKALADAVTAHSARSGLAIVMSPETGAILAVSHYPFFNPNAFGEYHRENWRNRSITDPFEPGSTMKIFSAAAAIEHGGYTENSIFYCENGTYRIGKNIVHDTKKHGWLSMQQIVKYSSNIGAVKIGEKIGPEILYTTLRDFGFGAKTGIDCPGETPGSLAPFHKWTKIDAGTIAFGQGISASALQLITATAAIANKGILMKPYIVQAVTDPNGQLLKSFGPREVRRVISVRTARKVTEMMQTVVSQDGTGTNAALEGYSACGKTGTAQKVGEDGKYAKNKYIASFVGFAPVNNPRAAILVIVNEPEKNHYGGTVAAPAFRTIAHGTLHYLNVSPETGAGDFTADPKTKASI